MAVINSTLSNTLLSGTSGDDYIANGYYDSSDTWHDGKSKVTIDADAGDDTVDKRSSDNVTILSGDGNDMIGNSYGNVRVC